MQSAHILEQNVFIEAPGEMTISLDVVLSAVKTLHGIPESPVSWYITYLENHIRCLGISRSKTDPSVL